MTEHIAPWPFRVDEINNYAWIGDVFSEREIEKIIQLGKDSIPSKAKTIDESDDTVRNSNIGWIKPEDDSNWLFAKMTDIIMSMNNQYFNFDLFGLTEGFQFTEYKAPAGHYSYHTDRATGSPVRKLSLTMQLSDPEDYEGGDLEFLFGKEPVSASKERGCITLFPSWELHRVTPVTKGKRYSLVAWVTGPNFK
jgi:PKHD-type hydroxylase